MMDDMLLVATANIHAPELGFLVERVADMVEYDCPHEFMDRCVAVLSQLLFEDSLLPYFIQSQQKLEYRLALMVPTTVESGRELALLRRRLEDLKPHGMVSLTDSNAIRFPETPTFVFVRCLDPDTVKIGEAIVKRLLGEGFVADLTANPLTLDYVKGSYAGTIIMETLYFMDYPEYALARKQFGYLRELTPNMPSKFV